MSKLRLNKRMREKLTEMLYDATCEALPSRRVHDALQKKLIQEVRKRIEILYPRADMEILRK